jgi:hypothetical protein
VLHMGRARSWNMSSNSTLEHHSLRRASIPDAPPVTGAFSTISSAECRIVSPPHTTPRVFPSFRLCHKRSPALSCSPHCYTEIVFLYSLLTPPDHSPDILCNNFSLFLWL